MSNTGQWARPIESAGTSFACSCLQLWSWRWSPCLLMHIQLETSLRCSGPQILTELPAVIPLVWPRTTLMLTSTILHRVISAIDTVWPPVLTIAVDLWLQSVAMVKCHVPMRWLWHQVELTRSTHLRLLKSLAMRPQQWWEDFASLQPLYSTESSQATSPLSAQLWAQAT